MTEQELLKILSTPGAIVAVVIWLHFRVKNIETRLDMIARHFGVQTPRCRNYKMARGPLLVLLALALSLFGCASPNHREMTRQERRIDNVLNPPSPPISGRDRMFNR